MDFLTLVFISIGLSLDDFSLAFALILIMNMTTRKERMRYTAKLALAFSFSTAALPLIGWLVGSTIYNWVVNFSAWVVLITFCGVGAWIIKEAFEDEEEQLLKSRNKNLTSFWSLLVMGILGSIDEGAIGIGLPFLSFDILSIIISVIIANTILIFIAMSLSMWRAKINQKLPPIISGIILIVLGVINWIELLF